MTLPATCDRADVDRALKATRIRALIDAATALTDACPDHSTGDTCFMSCQCDGADAILRMAEELT